MKGGGVKGYSYLGAIEELQAKYTFDTFVGTSAGAIAAVLLGAGYSLEELKDELGKKDFRDFFDTDEASALHNFKTRGGLFEAKNLVDWMDDLLSRKLRLPGRATLGDLRHHVVLYASRRGQTALKFDSWVDKKVYAASAVRCSMAIPGVFIPETVDGQDVFDGGMQNNYPVKAFKSDYKDTPFVGLYLGPQTYQSDRAPWFVGSYLIMAEASDVEAANDHSDQTVFIDPRPIGTLDFGLSKDERDLLLVSGREGALAHLERDGARHLGAISDRNRLRELVESQRAAARAATRSKWRRLLKSGCFVALAASLICIVALAGGVWWWLTPEPLALLDIDMPTWMAKYEAVRDKPAELVTFKRDHGGLVNGWDAFVVETNPSDSLPHLILTAKLGDFAHVLRADFSPDEFKKSAVTLNRDDQIEIAGEISKGTDSLMPYLIRCRVKRVIKRAPLPTSSPSLPPGPSAVSPTPGEVIPPSSPIPQAK